jgi:uncharacterized protein YrzB (UPF0473 family)
MKKYDVVTYKDEKGNEGLFQVLFTFDIDEAKISCAVIFPKGGNGQTDLQIVTYEYVDNNLVLGVPTGEAVWNRIDEEIEKYFEIFG